MFPFRDHNPSNRIPFVTWALIAINIAVYASYATLDERATAQVFYTWGLVPIVSAPETYFSSMFLHGGLMHLAGNMLFLYVYGDNIEDQMGHLGFTLFYALCGMAAGAAQVVSDPSSQVPMVGASGAIAGVMGGYLLLFPRARVDVLIFLVVYIRVIPIPAYIVLGAWLAIQLVQGSVTPTEGGGVAYWAHIGGFIAGLIMAIPIWRKRGGPAFWRRTHGHPPHPEAQYKMVKTHVPAVRRR